MRTLPFLAALLLAFGCGNSTESGTATEDPTDVTAPAEASAAVPSDLSEIGSDAVETLLTDGPIHVHRVVLAPGDSLPAHEGGDRVVYALTELPALTFATDGEPEERAFAEGDVHYHEGGVHTVGNTGDAEVSFLVFERRGEALPEAAADGSTDIPTPGEGAADEVIFDDDFAEVHRVSLQPGAALPPHGGDARAVYALSGYTVEFAGPDGTREQRFEEGEAHYHEPGDHTVENAGETVAEFLVVEFKR